MENGVRKMYKVIIADDEKIIRVGLKNLIDWNALGFEIIESFGDGQEIIEYLEYAMPDVIITDIKMNHVSGIDVACHVFERHLPCKVVLISGFQEFDLALKAVRYGVKDYLLKPISVDAIEETFGKLKADLDAFHAEEAQKAADKERLEESNLLLEERFFSDLVMGVTDSSEYIKNCLNILYPKMDVEHSRCLLADIDIQEFDHFMDHVWAYNYDQLEVNLHHFLQIYKNEYSFHLVYKNGGLLEVVGIHIGEAGERESCQEEAQRALDCLLQEMEQTFQFKAHAQIRRIYDTVYDMIRLSEDIQDRAESVSGYEQRLEEQKKLIMSNISLGNIVTAQKLFHNILTELGGFPTGKRNNIIIEILTTMNTVLRDVNEKLWQSLQPYFNYSAVLTMGKSEEVRIHCDRIFDRIKAANEKKEYYDTNSLINKAKAYIQENIYRDISQEETANQLFICSSYLSRLFKKQTGESFIQYVTRVKMEKAVELLKDPQYKTYQVSQMLGYKTSRYFSRLFRAQTGMNPSEYRGRVLHVGGEFDEN